MFEATYPPWDFTDRNRYTQALRLNDESFAKTRISLDLASRKWLVALEPSEVDLATLCVKASKPW